MLAAIKNNLVNWFGGMQNIPKTLFHVHDDCASATIKSIKTCDSSRRWWIVYARSYKLLQLYCWSSHWIEPKCVSVKFLIKNCYFYFENSKKFRMLWMQCCCRVALISRTDFVQTVVRQLVSRTFTFHE